MIRKCWLIFTTLPTSPNTWPSPWWIIFSTFSWDTGPIISIKRYSPKLILCMIHQCPIIIFPEVIKDLSQRIFLKQKKKKIYVTKHFKFSRFSFFLRKLNGNGLLWNIRRACYKRFLKCFSFLAFTWKCCC